MATPSGSNGRHISSLGAASREATPWRTGLSVVLLAVCAKGLAFIREPIIAAVLGASASSDGYYLAIGLPFLLYNLLGLPFSLWVTARLAAVGSGSSGHAAQTFYRRSLWGGLGASVLVALGLVGLSRVLVHVYASGLQGSRLDDAAALCKLGAVALPALTIQAVASGRLFAEHRFRTVYIWLVAAAVVGLVGVVTLTPRYGAAGAVVSFVVSWWTSAVALSLVSQSRTAVTDGAEVGAAWGGELGPGVVYRAVAMQLFFQGSGFLVYNFASRLAEGEIAATLFASKVIMAIYETVVLTAGVLVFPRIARFLQQDDERSVGLAVKQALEWLIPVTAASMVVLAVSRTELVAVIYGRHAFDEHAVRLVSQALLGYAPYLVGIALVEVLHRTMVLRGTIGGYFLVFGGAMLVNTLTCILLVPRFGILGVAAAASIGMLAASGGLWAYADRRLPSLRAQRIPLLVGRTTAATGVALAVLLPLRSRLATPGTLPARLLLVAGASLGTALVFAAVMLLLGYRRPRQLPARDAGGET